MNPTDFLQEAIKGGLKSLYSVELPQSEIQVQATRKEFEGDYTLVVFPLLKMSKKAPEATAQEIGAYLEKNYPDVDSFNVIKGFLNIKLAPSFWAGVLKSIGENEDYGQFTSTGKTVMVEFSSPNTNKPLHLGHIRNNLLGWSVSQLLAANGHNIVKVNLVNDRGIHICKSMLAWLKEGNGETPASTGLKGDHFVGDYYVKFNDMLTAEVKGIMEREGIERDEAEKKAGVLKEAQEMLLKWERGDKEVVDLWKKMNGWVYEGFDVTYRNLGIEFDKTYYESETYLLGKSLVLEGLEKGIFEKQEDDSIWCDLTEEGLDKKLLLRSDGTSVYMTQDIGTAHQRYDEYGFDEHIYVVGNEQNYHFQVLKLILKKLGFEWSDSIYHLSYGMVELPEGKMKSREGTVVDADDLLESMYNTARETSLELGKIEDMNDEEQDALFKMISLGALKYFIIKVDPKKTMLFDPKESIDFNGNTGPFIQYTHARIKSILRKAAEQGIAPSMTGALLLPKEEIIVQLLSTYPDKIREGGEAHSPAIIANYAYDLAKEFNQYYHDTSILREEDSDTRAQRLYLISIIAQVLVKAMGILGISLPERM
jgi:arginyl-tRNA synthetase